MMPPAQPQDVPKSSRPMSAGNRTATHQVGSMVIKYLRPFADVKLERIELAHEGGYLAIAQGAGVVPLLGGGETLLAVEELTAAPPLSAPPNLLLPDPPVSEWRYLVSQHIEGKTLKEKLLERQANQEPGSQLALKAITWIQALCTALRRLHEAPGAQQLIHRDITPSNVLISASGQVFLNDFGLAHQPIRGELPDNSLLQGTKAYLAPELRSGWQPTPASDIYQVGLLWASLLYPEAEAAISENRSHDLMNIVKRSDTHPLLIRALSLRQEERPSAAQITHAATP
ncbi:MAG: protein kinase [Polyangiaceae bacterium]|nr:protein kinase [Polyangiaceae bacterium]